MKKVVGCLLILIFAVQLTLYASSEESGYATYERKDNTVEIIWKNVNVREEPNGKIIGQLAGNEVLTWIGETRQDGELWYHVYSGEYGNGYVKAVYAMPTGLGTNKNEGEHSVFTDQLLSYYEALLRFQFEYGYRIWQESSDYSVCDTNKVGNEVEEQIDIVLLMYCYGIIAQDSNKSLLSDPSVPLREKHQIACSILRTHYGTDDLWYIFTAASSVGMSIRPEDWHSPEMATSEDKMKLYKMIQSVEAEYR